MNIFLPACRAVTFVLCQIVRCRFGVMLLLLVGWLDFDIDVVFVALLNLI